MKKVVATLAAVMFVAVMSMGVSSCGNTEKGGKKDKKEKIEVKSNEEMIVGEWLANKFCEGDNCKDAHESGFDKGTIVFEKNGDFVDDSDGKYIKGTWEIEGKTLFITYDTGRIIKWEIKNLTNNEMAFESKNKDISIYLKRA